jgi:hypothetical protein
MTQIQLDKLFTNNYEQLRTYAHKALRAIKLNHEPETIVADAYCHSLAMVDEITDEGHMLSIAKNYIKQNINWWNSPYRRQQRGSELNSCEAVELPTPSVLPEFEHMIELLVQWQQTLNARERRLFNCFTKLEIRKGADLANYLDISQSGAYLIIREARELENRLKDWLTDQII